MTTLVFSRKELHCKSKMKQKYLAALGGEEDTFGKYSEGKRRRAIEADSHICGYDATETGKTQWLKRQGRLRLVLDIP